MISIKYKNGENEIIILPVTSCSQPFKKHFLMFFDEPERISDNRR